jgi:hypothetical protein
MTESPKHHFGRLRYDIAIPPESPGATLMWQFGSDAFSRSVSERLGFTLPEDMLRFSVAACNRDPKVLDKVRSIAGRSANFEAPEPARIMDTRYDTLQIGGFGYQKIAWKKGSIGSADMDAAVSLPDTENYEETNPGIARVTVIDGNRQLELHDPYSFSGAYTREQALTKVAYNLLLLDAVSSVKPPPFVVPIPVGVGVYPGIVNDAGEPAYFISFLVPYGGRRTGVAEDPKTYNPQSFYRDMIQTPPAMAKAARFIHDTTGFAHYQMHPGNYFVPKGGGLPFLCDFSTMYPLSTEAQAQSRAVDLSKMLISIMEGVQASGLRVDMGNLLMALFKDTVDAYAGAKLPLPKSGTSGVHHAIANQIRFALESGIIKPAMPPEQARAAVSAIRGHLDSSIAGT